MTALLASCEKEAYVESYDVRNKFRGTFLMYDTITTDTGEYPASYTISISKTGYEGDTISVNNFVETTRSNKGEVVSDSSFVVFKNQEVGISAIATLHLDTLNFIYTTDVGSRRGYGVKL